MKNKTIDLDTYLRAKKAYHESLEPIEKEAVRLLKIINRIDEVEGFDHLNVDKININKDGSGIIHFFGEDYWQYGGYESYKFSMPADIIFCKQERKKYFAEIMKIRLSVMAEEKNLKRLREQREKEKYEELKLKFEKGEK